MSGSVYPCDFCGENGYAVEMEQGFCTECAKTYEKRKCTWYEGCDHWYIAYKDCERCAGHGPSHEPFTKGHQPHCTGNCCW